MIRYSIEEELKRRILVLDGGMGTLVQGRNPSEEDFRGERFKGWSVPLAGCNDVLALTSPGIIASIHEAYLAAGADIVSTDSFNANAISLADYSLSEHVYDINRAAGRLARAAADKFTLQNPTKPRFAAGSMGPTGKSASMPSDFSSMASRSVTFDMLVEAYTTQARGLADGGVDVFLVETAFDPINVKAALTAIASLGRDIPVMVSCTVGGEGGRLLSGQSVEAFLAAVAHTPNLLSVGVNCALGAEQMLPLVERLAAAAECRVSAHPNAGLPDMDGNYDQTPEKMAAQIAGYLRRGVLNIVGGCCGTTPAHIALIARLAAKSQPRPLPAPAHRTWLSGLEAMEVSPERNFINIGERTNVAGSARFARLIREGDMDGAMAVAREQVAAGAQIVDVCMDDGLIDGPAAMTSFLNTLSTEAQVAGVPVMIDSSNWDTIRAGLRCVQGKGVVNSISLKEGEAEFLRRAAEVRALGAAAVVMLFDERGQADTFERKVEIARRAYDLMTGAGFPPEDIIFDANVLAVATGIPEHDGYGVAFIEAVRWIKRNLPHAKTSGGISNLSFALRGNNAVREAMHSVFLYHAVAAGLDMGIVNPAMLQVYSDIEPKLLELCEDAVLARHPDAAERLTAYAQGMAARGTAAAVPVEERARGEQPLFERIETAMLRGLVDHIEQDALEAYAEAGTPLAVIDRYLMPAMERVGELFAQGKMFLPQVVKSARVMRSAVDALTPHMMAQSREAGYTGRVLIATVKGDVHDIGKNITSVVMSCNGYLIEDLGVMVPSSDIVDRALEWGADVIGLSALITPSLAEMAAVLELLERRGVRIPVLIGGATTSPLHTAVKLAPLYSAPVVYVRDASSNVKVLARLKGEREAFEAELREEQRRLREAHQGAVRPSALRPLSEARRGGHVKGAAEAIVPKNQGVVVLHDYPVREVIPYIDWREFFPAWGLKGSYPDILDSPEKGAEARKLMADALAMLEKIADEGSPGLHAALGVFPASSQGDDIVVADGGRRVRLPMLRNQSAGAGANLCLADYLLPEGGGDHVGLFAVTAGAGLLELVRGYREAGDDYGAIMCKLLADRLAEAFTEATHARMRRQMWGLEERITPREAVEGRYSGKRYAFGYPSCPDHSLKAEVFDLLRAGEALPMMSLTESYMISPGESLCGIVICDPEAEYFAVGRVDGEQLRDYAARRGMDEQTLRRLIPNNVQE